MQIYIMHLGTPEGQAGCAGFSASKLILHSVKIHLLPRSFKLLAGQIQFLVIVGLSSSFSQRLAPGVYSQHLGSSLWYLQIRPSDSGSKVAHEILKPTMPILLELPNLLILRLQNKDFLCLRSENTALSRHSSCWPSYSAPHFLCLNLFQSFFSFLLSLFLTIHRIFLLYKKHVLKANSQFPKISEI